MEILKTGLIFRNPIPHVHSVHAYFPSVVSMDNGEMLATAVLGEAFESPNMCTHVFRSTDGGAAWKHEGPLYPGVQGRLVSDASRVTALGGGNLVTFTVRHDRTQHPDEGLTNPETLGFVPTELCLFRSADYGRSWRGPDVFKPPLEGPSFELCCPITVLGDGRWILPTSTWQAWDGYCPNGIRTIALVSEDAGKTWPGYWNVMVDPNGATYFWESKIVELPDGTLLAMAWAYDAAAKEDRPNQYALSCDGGKTWTPPASTGLEGQTLTPMALGGGRILCVYRRIDMPGLWACLAHLQDGAWVTQEQVPLWGAGACGLTGTSANMSQNFNVLRFGAPCLTRTPQGEIFVAFWCYEDCVSVIRWFTLAVAH
ncbi:MAG TPA: sialidase family protein [Candidatus Hydrogenedentes bacterium]|mgnify:FL=1|nr:sialidase family protein [Candidatus Hydrogenedentota bacterium]